MSPSIPTCLHLKHEVLLATKPDVAAVRLAVSSDIAELQNVVGSKNHAELDANVNAWIAIGNRDTKAFILLRSDLGLAPPPG